MDGGEQMEIFLHIKSAKGSIEKVTKNSNHVSKDLCIKYFTLSYK
jgi:hypothetical protein